MSEVRLIVTLEAATEAGEATGAGVSGLAVGLGATLRVTGVAAAGTYSAAFGGDGTGVLAAVSGGFYVIVASLVESSI